MRKDLLTFIIIVCIILITGNITVLPWWSFVVPVILLGIIAGWYNWKVSCLLVGFLAGAITWSGTFLYYHLHFHAPFTNNREDLPIGIMLFVAGLIGGGITSLSLYTGRSFISR